MDKPANFYGRYRPRTCVTQRARWPPVLHTCPCMDSGAALRAPKAPPGMQNAILGNAHRATFTAPRNATPNTTATHYPNFIQNATQLPSHISTWPQHAAHNRHWRSLLEGHQHAHRPARQVYRTAQGPPPARMHHAPPAFHVVAHTRPTKPQAGSGALKHVPQGGRGLLREAGHA